MTSSAKRRGATIVVQTVAEVRSIKAALLNGTSAAAMAPRGTRLIHEPSGAEFEVQRVGTLATALGNRLVQVGVLDYTDFLTAADLTAAVGKCVKLNGAVPPAVVLATAIGEECLGILTSIDSAAIGAPCIVRALGPAMVITSAAGLAAGVNFCSSAVGLAITPQVTAAAANVLTASWIMGRSIDIAAANAATMCMISSQGVRPTSFI